MDRIGATAIAMLEAALGLLYNKDLDILPTSTSATCTNRLEMSPFSIYRLMFVQSPLIWKCTRPGNVI